MATASLWPDFAAPPRGMRQILLDAAGDIDQKTNGVLRFYVETLHLDRGFLYSGHLRAEQADYNFLLFRVETVGLPPFPARLIAPDQYIDVQVSDESELKNRLAQLFNHPATKESVLHLMATFG